MGALVRSPCCDQLDRQGAPVADAETTDDLVDVFGKRLPYKYIVAIVYVSALFLDILDLTIVNVAIPALGREFATENAEWIVLGYTLSLAVWIPVSGWMGDRFGTKRTFMFAFAAFIFGSLLCAMAQSIEQLIAFRVLQGVGGGMLTPVGVAMLFRAFPPRERARASTYIMIPTLIAPALGPILGGLLVTHANWRWIFLINIPIGLVGLAFGLKFLREHREPSAGRLDVPGFILSGSALALIVYALSQGPREGWTSTVVVTTGVLGVLCAIAMVRVELTVEQPMLDLRLLGNRIFRQCNVVSFLSTMSFLGLLFVMPLYLQLLRGQDALHSGLTTFPQAFGVMISSQFAGRLYARIGPRRLMTGGLLASGLVICDVHRPRSGHQPVGDQADDVRPWPVHGLRVRADASGELRDHQTRRQRSGVVDLLDATAGRGVDRRGHPGQHPRQLHVAQPTARSRRDRQCPHRVPVGVRRRCGAVAGCGTGRIVRSRLRRRRHHGSATPMSDAGSREWARARDRSRAGAWSSSASGWPARQRRGCWPTGVPT